MDPNVIRFWPRGVDHFAPEEFDDPAHPGSWRHMSLWTITRLNDLREKTGWPIITHNKFGLRGCVCVKPYGHSENSHHYIDCDDGCSAVDWHFDTDIDPRFQALLVLRSDFKGIGIYYDWKWDDAFLPVGFHTDMRARPQVWKRDKGRYTYLLQ